MESPTEQVAAAIELLERIVADRAVLATLDPEAAQRLVSAAGRVSRPDRRERKRFARERERLRREGLKKDQSIALSGTGIRAQRRAALQLAQQSGPKAVPALEQAYAIEDETLKIDGPLPEARNCYVCKTDYTTLHSFYDALCPSCGDFNFHKRTELADLTGRVALITGARIKIGYQGALKLLRSNAQVIVTTRFPHDAAQRYAQEADFEQWSDRLQIYGLDLRHTPSIEALCSHVAERYERLDYIVNNACQTVRRPPDFYAHLIEAEQTPTSELPEHVTGVLGSYGPKQPANALVVPPASRGALSSAIATKRRTRRWTSLSGGTTRWRHAASRPTHRKQLEACPRGCDVH